jgi:hypothetical protein
MSRRGVYDYKGELFAYLEGNTLFTVDGEMTGRLEGGYIVDTAGNQVWRVHDSGLYSLDEWINIGYLGGSASEYD